MRHAASCLFPDVAVRVTWCWAVAYQAEEGARVMRQCPEVGAPADHQLQVQGTIAVVDGRQPGQRDRGEVEWAAVVC